MRGPSGRINRIRIEAVRAENLAEAETEIDVATFIQWIDARAADNTELADSYRQRLRDEFQPAFDAWLATDAFVNSSAPLTPFAIPEYRLEATADAERLDADAEASSAVVRRSIERAFNYVLAVVLFSVTLCFAGMSTRLRGVGARRAMLIIASRSFSHRGVDRHLPDEIRHLTAVDMEGGSRRERCGWVYWRAIATRRRSSGLMRWSLSCGPVSSWIQWMLPVKALLCGP